MTDEQTALLADVERTLTEQLVNWVRRETRQAFAALAVEMERAARQGGSREATEAVATRQG
jgi:N-acetylglucosamine kinase-like BadF-type ATPase